MQIIKRRGLDKSQAAQSLQLVRSCFEASNGLWPPVDFTTNKQWEKWWNDSLCKSDTQWLAYDQQLVGYNELEFSFTGRASYAYWQQKFTQNDPINFFSMRSALLRRLMISPQMRGSGLSERLLRLAEQEARARQAEQIALLVLEDNVSALNFYRKIGYCEHSYRYHGDKSGKRLILFSAEL